MKNKAAIELGRLGGRKTVEKYGSEHFRKITKGWPKGKPRRRKTDRV